VNDEPPLRRRLLWFVVLWCASVAALGIVAWAIRSILLP
jgi:hypothetical protein